MAPPAGPDRRAMPWMSTPSKTIELDNMIEEE
jgi:hypothetical protein